MPGHAHVPPPKPWQRQKRRKRRISRDSSGEVPQAIPDLPPASPTWGGGSVAAATIAGIALVALGVFLVAIPVPQRFAYLEGLANHGGNIHSLTTPFGVVCVLLGTLCFVVAGRAVFQAKRFKHLAE